MNKSDFLSRARKIAHKLSPGFLILGICLIAWSSYQIYTQSAPVPVAIEQQEEPLQPVALAPESLDAVIKDLERETQTETKIQTETQIQTETATQIQTGAKAEVEKQNEPEPEPEPEPKTATATKAEVQTASQEPTTSATKIASATKQVAHEILYPVRPTIGENIGNLTLPAINQVLPIVHGTDEDELSKGIGHFAGSVLPGENDNSVLSGHRDTVFRELGELEITDQLIVDTSAGTFTYEIREIKIVPKDDKSIITPTSSAVLTVTTCYPFNFVGSAPDRYILIADLVSSE